MRDSSGFTMAEILIILAILAILVAISVPSFIAASQRAKEASVKANMHAFQFVAEDYLVKRGTTTYADRAQDLAGALLKGFNNPYGHEEGEGVAWEDRPTMGAEPSAVRGITSYADSAGVAYNVKGYGSTAPLLLVLSSGGSSIRSSISRSQNGNGDVSDDEPVIRSGPTSVEVEP